MSKQKLAQMVMQKMLQKKARQQANRPHYQVLQLLCQFNIQENATLAKNIKNIQAQIAYYQSLSKTLQKHSLQLDSTGKKQFPRIIIKPQFIATQHVPILVKQFYRKSANSFLKKDIIRKKTHQKFVQKQQSIKRMIRQTNKIQQQLKNCLATHIQTQNERRVKVLKQDLRLRFIKDQQRRIQALIQSERMDNIDLVKQYQIKKTNLDNRIAYSRQLDIKIQEQKDLIERTYNPIAYRQYLRLMFLIRAKNQKLKKNLYQAIAQIDSLTQNTEKHQKHLVDTQSSFLLYGRTYDSPSRNLGRRQKQRQKQLNIDKDENQKKQITNIKKRKQSESKIRDLSESRFNNTMKTTRSVSTLPHNKSQFVQKSVSKLSTAAKSSFKNRSYY